MAIETACTISRKTILSKLKICPSPIKIKKLCISQMSKDQTQGINKL